MNNNLTDVQQMKNVYNTDKQIIIIIIEYQVPFYESTFVNMITDHKLYVLCFTETWLKPDEYIILNESQDYCYKMSRVQKAKGEVSLQTPYS